MIQLLRYSTAHKNIRHVCHTVIKQKENLQWRRKQYISLWGVVGREHQGDSSASKPKVLSLISETHMVEGELSPE